MLSPIKEQARHRDNARGGPTFSASQLRPEEQKSRGAKSRGEGPGSGTRHSEGWEAGVRVACLGT